MLGPSIQSLGINSSMSSRTRVLVPLLAILLSVPPCAWAKAKGVQESVVVNAPQNQVWNTITNANRFDASISEEKTNEAIVEQEFKSLPVFGTCHTTMRVTAVPRTSINYKMIKSNRLKDMAGGWTLKATGPEKTKLTLESYVDPGLPVPRFIIDHFVRMKVKGRLKKTKKLAEELYLSSKSKKTDTDSAVNNSKQPTQSETTRISERNPASDTDSSNKNP